LSAPRSGRISAVSYVEAGAVIDGSKDPVASRRFDELIEAAEIAIEPVTEAQARIARQAYRDFGKTAAPRQTDFGDCFSYALAKPKESRCCSKDKTSRGRCEVGADSLGPCESRPKR